MSNLKQFDKLLSNKARTLSDLVMHNVHIVYLKCMCRMIIIIIMHACKSQYIANLNISTEKKGYKVMENIVMLRNIIRGPNKILFIRNGHSPSTENKTISKV